MSTEENTNNNNPKVITSQSYSTESDAKKENPKRSLQRKTSTIGSIIGAIGFGGSSSSSNSDNLHPNSSPVLDRRRRNPTSSNSSGASGHRRTKSHGGASIVVSSEERRGFLGFLVPNRPQNIRFYKGKRESKPDGDYIDTIHRVWFYRYLFLEDHHGYIEWLFPTPTTNATNTQCYALRVEEATKMSNDLEISIRVVLSYRMMLNFYGIVLVNDQTGEIARHPEIWAARYGNLNTSPQNNLRITRILSSLIHLGFGKKYVGKFVDFIQNEIEANEVLPNCRKSLEDFWIPLKSEAESAVYENYESVFFKSTSASEFTQYQADIARGKYWYGKASDVQVNEFKEALKEANATQVRNCDEKKMTLKDVEGLTSNGSSTNFFKQHYNSEKEKEEATTDFFKKVQEEKEKVAEGRKKAEAALRAMVEARKTGSVGSGTTSPTPASDFTQSSIL